MLLPMIRSGSSTFRRTVRAALLRRRTGRSHASMTRGLWYGSDDMNHTGPAPVSEHGFEHAVRRRMPIGEGLDVDYDLLAHVDAALNGGRAHVRQQDHVVERQQLGIDRRLVLEHVEPGPGQFALL